MPDTTAEMRFTSNLHPLHPLFRPTSVALVGATEKPNSVGRVILENLTSFKGKVYAVNSRHDTVLGLKTYQKVSDIPEPVDVAVIATPAVLVPEVIRDCVKAQTKTAIIISAGFKEFGEAGAALEREILHEVKKSDLRVLGPNCLGLMNPTTGFNGTFARQMIQAGSVGFLSQSGALCTAILDWSLQQNIGFSAFVSTGSMIDIDWGDLIYYLGDDPNTRSILIYMESVANASSFLSAAREVALTKPIILIKAGRTAQAAQAATSHTGALTGSDDVFDTACRRCGVLRVENIEELFYMAELLSKQPRPQGRRLAIVTNAGGPGVLSTDALISGGGELAALAPKTIAALNEVLPPHWSHANPVDIIGDAGPERYKKAIEIVTKDTNSDGLLVIMCPQGMTDPVHVAEAMKDYAQMGKPILASWMGGSEIAPGVHTLNQSGIPAFPFPEMAAKAFNYMWRYNENLRALYETPLPEATTETLDSAFAAEGIIREVQESGRTLLTEFEAKKLLAAYNIPTIPTVIATTVDEAICAAEKIGYPVVLKLHSFTVTHKSDVGGVMLELANKEVVAKAFEQIRSNVAAAKGLDHFQGVTVQPMAKASGYELILGCSVDAQFGPLLLFGAGGIMVEIFKDRALGLPPLNTTLARRLMEQTQIYKALQGVRGRKAVDLAELERVLVRFSRMIVENPRIKEADINPLLVSNERLIALDARVVLHPAETPREKLPRPAIRPYPVQYVSSWHFLDGRQVILRPIRPEDEPLLIEFHKSLSDESVHSRYLQLLSVGRRTEHERLTRICFIDYDRQIAIVAEETDAETRERRILAVGRLSRWHGRNEAEVALLVMDKHQGSGLGAELLRRLINIAKDEGLNSLSALMLRDNLVMQHVMQKAGFLVKAGGDRDTVLAYLELKHN